MIDILVDVPRPSPSQIRERLGASFALDLIWSTTMGQVDVTKEEALKMVTRILADSKTPYAIIGGIAVQIYSEEPRTTKDIDIGLRSVDDVPAVELTLAGFKYEGRFPHSDNWRAPGKAPRKQRTPIQFSFDDLTAVAAERSETYKTKDMRLKIATLKDLILLKLAAAEEPRRRPSKRRSDATDISRLLEEHPEIEKDVPDARKRLALIDDMIRGL